MNEKTDSSEAEIKAEFYRLGNALTQWIFGFNGYGKTYRQFWDAYAVAAAPFTEFLDRPDVPPSLQQQSQFVFADTDGMVPENVDENLTEDDLIVGHQIPGGNPNWKSKPLDRSVVSTILSDIEFGPSRGSAGSLQERIALGSRYLAAPNLRDEDRDWAAAELQKLKSRVP